MMKVKILTLLISLALNSCANLQSGTDSSSKALTSDDTNFVQQNNTLSPLESSLLFKKQFTHTINTANNHSSNAIETVEDIPTEKAAKENIDAELSSSTYNINFYARGLMQDLIANLQYVNTSTPVAVTSFVMLDSDYNESNLLGNQLAESLIHEVHKFGIPVIDFKTTGFIRITEQGDFAFSKDYEDFSGDLPARYIISGTLSKHKDGYIVNARIVGLESKAVVASAQSFIPKEIANALLTSSEKNINEEPALVAEQSISPTTKRPITKATIKLIAAN